MRLLLDLALAAPVLGVAAGVVVPERAVQAMRAAAMFAAAFWFALLVDGSLLSVSHLHSAPLVAAVGCGAALVVATLDAGTVVRPAWAGVALAAASLAVAAGHTGTDGGGAVVALAIAVAAASLAGGPSTRVLVPAAVGLVVAAAGVVALRSAANSWQLPLADVAGSHRGDGLAIFAGAVLLVLAGSNRSRAPSALLVPTGAFLAAQAAPIVHRADGLGFAAIVLAGAAAAAAAIGGRTRAGVLHHPTAALMLLGLAALVGPGATRGPALLLAAAGTLACTLEWPAAAVLGVPGGVALAIALAARGGATAFVIGALAGVVAVALAAAAEHRRLPRPTVWSAPVLVLGAWLLIAPGTWGWVGPVSLRSYDIGAARAAAAAALCIATLVLLGREPGGWYARCFPSDSPGEDVVRH